MRMGLGMLLVDGSSLYLIPWFPGFSQCFENHLPGCSIMHLFRRSGFKLTSCRSHISQYPCVTLLHSSFSGGLLSLCQATCLISSRRPLLQLRPRDSLYVNSDWQISKTSLIQVLQICSSFSRHCACWICGKIGMSSCPQAVILIPSQWVFKSWSKDYHRCFQALSPGPECQSELYRCHSNLSIAPVYRLPSFGSPEASWNT